MEESTWAEQDAIEMEDEEAEAEAKVDGSEVGRYKYRDIDEIQRITDAVVAAGQCPDPVSEEVSAEEALRRLEAKDEGFNILDVEQYLPMTDEGLKRLDVLVRERGVRGHVCLGLLKVWAAWEKLGLPPKHCLPPPPLPPERRVPRLERPSADELWKYVQLHQPVVISGALDAEGFPPLERFKDFDYLRRRCGRRKVKVKGDFFADKEGRNIFITDPAAEITFREFLNAVEEAEQLGVAPNCYMGKVKLQDCLPEIIVDIEAAPRGPWQQFGGCFGKCAKGVHTYFGCGLNTTSLHCDPSENLLTVMMGTKTFDLFPPSDADCLYLMRPPAFLNSPVPPLTHPDKMSRDLERRYPLYRHTQPTRVDLKAGDILYLPAFWWHGVTGGLKRNMILNYWCEFHPDKAAAPGTSSEGAMAVLDDISRCLQQDEQKG